VLSSGTGRPHAGSRALAARGSPPSQKWLARARAPRLSRRDFRTSASYNADARPIRARAQDARLTSRGDESILAHHLHAEHAHFECALPGVRVRCFLDRPGDGRRELFELPLALDTCFVDMDALRVVLVWRGRLAPADAAHSRGWLLVEEKLDAPTRDAASYTDEFEARLAAQSDAWADAELADAERALEEATARRA
jgi:hypothetical protein